MWASSRRTALGTRTGDPIEAGAIQRVFGNGRTKRLPLYMGSVKTNFGHLENASGIISVIKATLMLERGYILHQHQLREAQSGHPASMSGTSRFPPVFVRGPKTKSTLASITLALAVLTPTRFSRRRQVPGQISPQDTKEELGNPRLFVLSAHDERRSPSV